MIIKSIKIVIQLKEKETHYVGFSRYAILCVLNDVHTGTLFSNFIMPSYSQTTELQSNYTI